MGVIGIKRCRVVRGFKKYELALVTKCTNKVLFLKNANLGLFALFQ
jgi:hypothetical protein